MNIKPMHKPRSPLGSLIPRPSLMARDAGPDQSFSGKVRSRHCTVVSNAESQQRREAPRGCKPPPSALTRSPSVPQHARRGPKRLRWMTGAIQPMHEPRSPLGSHIPSPSLMARDAGPDRSFSGKVRSRHCTVVSNAESQQRREAPRGCKPPPSALTRSPSVPQHARRGPKRLRWMTGAIQPATDT